MLQSVVIVGAGHAGFQTAASLRQEKFEGRITLIGDEPGLPYQRPPLSKAFMLGKTDRDALSFRAPKFFIDHRIDLIHGRVTAIDREARTVAVQDSEKVAYDHLVLAMGARNRPLGIEGQDLEGVHGLRTVEEASVLKQRFGAARNVVVIGAGFIGLEFAAVAKAAGATVHVLELAERPMARALSVAMSRAFEAALTQWGLQFHFNQRVTRIVGEGGRVTGVETAQGGHFPADLVVYGIGAVPNVEIAAVAGLTCTDGIVVDAHLVTSDPHISAIGDCVRFPADGVMLRLESVQNAVDQARNVAARLMGKDVSYRAVPWFWSDQAHLKLQMAGLMTGHDECVTIGNVPELAFSVLCFKEGQLIAVESVNRAGDHVAARRLLAVKPTLTPQQAAAPGFELKAFAGAASRAE